MKTTPTETTASTPSPGTAVSGPTGGEGSAPAGQTAGLAGGATDTRSGGDAAAAAPETVSESRESKPTSGLLPPADAAQPAAEPAEAPKIVADKSQDAGGAADGTLMLDGGSVAGNERSNLEKLGYLGDDEDGDAGRTRGRNKDDAKNAEGTESADDPAGDYAWKGEEEKAKEKKKKLDNARWDDDASVEEDELEEIEEEIAQQYWDWGATVHLSNDDSMSLASAQRVLWSVMNGRRPKASEIRPHELLNYFSFDTVPVAEGQMFSVLGAAEADDETLSVALAVKGATPPRQPLDLTLVVDRSGSMAAEGRMTYTTRGLEQMIDRLHPGDRVDLVTFETRVCTTLQDFVVGRDDPALLRHAMKALYPKGSTDLDGGLQEAYRIQSSRSAAETHGRNRRVMLITDAMMNTGTVDADVVAQIGTAFDEHRIRLTGVGVGREFNDEALDKLTEKGKGAYVYLGSEAVVDRVFGVGFDSLVQTIAHDVRFSLHLPPSLAMERFYGEEASTDAADIQPIHYYAGTSQVFLQDLRIREGGIVSTDPIKLRIQWRDAVTDEPDALELHTTVGALLDGEVRNLHKAQALMAWSDWTMSWASYAGGACGQPMEVYAEKVAKLADDAELGFLSGLTGQVCGRPVVAAAPVGYKVRLDSDIPIAEVALACGHRSWTERMRGGDTVARFDDARPGSCTLTLQGTVAMQTPVKVPETGGDVRCTVRGGRLSCS